MFFEYSCSSENELGNWDDYGLVTNLNMKENPVEEGGTMDDHMWRSNSQIRSSNKVMWRNRGMRRRRKIKRGSKGRGFKGRISEADEQMNSRRRLHYQSGKRSRGRNRPSLIKV